MITNDNKFEMNNKNQSKENWTKPEVNLLSVNENTLGISVQLGSDATVAALS